MEKEKLKKHNDHICRFNDGECICDCFGEGFEAGKKEAIEEIKKYLTEYMKKLCWTDRDIKYLLDDIKL